jgi:glycosyltransferase involved in cell wall biosynthesis
VLHLCPLWYPIARDAPGGIETFLAQLLEALRNRGCEATIIATGDSRVEADLVAAIPLGLHGQMKAGAVWEYGYYEQDQLRLALEHAPEFDLVHSHIGPGGYLLSGIPELQERVLHTIHTPVYGDQQWFVRRHPDDWYSTVSEHQAQKLRQAGATRCRAIHNGIDVAQFTFRSRGGDGLLFVGRMEAVKGPDVAVRVARALGRPLTVAGPIVEQDFFERTIVPFLDDRIRYVGVVDHRGKDALFGEAACALLPFSGEEPFGLVAIEAMACGTPVVALARGSLPEIVEPGLSGYLARDEAGLADLLPQAVALDRGAIREQATSRFDISMVAERYLQLYQEIIASVRGPLVGGGRLAVRGGAG